MSLTGAYFDEGNGPVLSYLSCSTGRESDIAECSMGRVGAVNCHHGRDAAVRCQCEKFVYCTSLLNGIYTRDAAVRCQCEEFVFTVPPS